MVTWGCCCWYLAKATEKNGASNVDPAPVRVGAWPPALAAATTEAAVSGLLVLAVLVQAAASSAITAAAAQVASRAGRWVLEPGWAVCAGMGCSFARGAGVQRGWAWRTQAWVAIWTASQGLPSGGV